MEVGGEEDVLNELILASLHAGHCSGSRRWSVPDNGRLDMLHKCLPLVKKESDILALELAEQKATRTEFPSIVDVKKMKHNEECGSANF